MWGPLVLWRIARNEHPHVVLEEDDTVIFSSRVIPGNEISISRLQNALSRQGVHVVTDKDHFIHVSGHPARDELSQMYQWVRPKIAIPVHGEARHLAEHAELAAACQVPQALAGRRHVRWVELIQQKNSQVFRWVRVTIKVVIELSVLLLGHRDGPSRSCPAEDHA